MASELFNTLTGYSVGIPAVTVIDGNGNVVSNFLNLSGNVTANKVYANSFFYANGQPFNADPGGSNTQLQYNNNGAFGGIPNVTWNGNILSLGSVSNVSIGGGVNGYVLQTDGTGNLSWTAQTGNGGGNGVPGGSNTQIQFNDAGTFGGDAGFTYNKNTNTLNVENISAGNSPDDTIVAQGNLSVLGNITAVGNITANYLIGNGSQLTGVISTTGNANYANYAGNAFSVTGSNVSGQVSNSLVAGTVYTNAQPNITSLGNLVNLNVDGNITGLGNIGISGDITASNISLGSDLTAANATFSNKVIVNSNLTVNTSAVLRVTGNINAAGSPNISLGTISNIHINGGTGGQVLSTDGTGNLYWATGGGGGNGVPGGFNQSVQFNTGGDFGGDVKFTYETTAGKLTVPEIRSNTSANFFGATSVNLGNVSNLRISGGLNGYVLSTDGSGNLAWTAGGGGGNGFPGGSNTQVQFNNEGTFGGSPFLTYNDYTRIFQVGGNLIANSFQIGSGVYKWSTSLVYFATTTSTSPAQILYSVPVANLSGVEFDIVATEPSGPSRQSCKISSLYYDETISYNEYSSLFINGGVGSFEVDYNAGNIITPPSLELKVTPNTSNPMTYKMLITIYAD